MLEHVHFNSDPSGRITNPNYTQNTYHWKSRSEVNLHLILVAQPRFIFSVLLRIERCSGTGTHLLQKSPGKLISFAALHENRVFSKALYPAGFLQRGLPSPIRQKSLRI